jgi:hypothetical protein
MNKLPAAIDLANRQAHHCLDRAEFFQTKSQAKYRVQAAGNYQEWGERWADLEELLRELARLRNACVRAGINTEW